jgi:hypothetical protein
MRKNKFVITGSTWAAVFALSAYLSRPKFWKIIKGIEGFPPDYPSPAKLYGKEMEPVSRVRFIEIHKAHYPGCRYITRGSKALKMDIRFGASPDLLIEDEFGDLVEGCELKNPHSKAVPKEVTNDLCGFLLQCILNMEVFNVPLWNLFIYRHETQEMAWFRIERNHECFKNKLYLETLNFMNSTEVPNRVQHNFKQKWQNVILGSFKITKIVL